EVEMLAQQVEQRGAGIEREVMTLAVDRQTHPHRLRRDRAGGHRSLLLSGSLGPDGRTLLSKNCADPEDICTGVRLEGWKVCNPDGAERNPGLASPHSAPCGLRLPP